uniref:Uncharacterized protein n=1 Tax=Rhizophora mucronata TaxID=61149 RepID=A0A2P2N6N2_RHIMU
MEKEAKDVEHHHLSHTQCAFDSNKGKIKIKTSRYSSEKGMQRTLLVDYQLKTHQ